VLDFIYWHRWRDSNSLGLSALVLETSPTLQRWRTDRTWQPDRDLNPEPSESESDALPIELSGCKMALEAGLEPATSALTERRSTIELLQNKLGKDGGTRTRDYLSEGQVA
jgi:hypothetical protein